MKRIYKTGLSNLLLSCMFLVFLSLNFSFFVPGNLSVQKLFSGDKQNTTPAFVSEQIREIYKMLPPGLKSRLNKTARTPSTTYLLDNGSFKVKNKIKIRINKYGEYEHLGLQVFDTNLTVKDYNEILDFIEREFLAYVLMEQNKKILNRMKFNKVKLSLNGIDFNTNSNIKSYLACNTTTPFSLKGNSQLFFAVWKIDNMTLLTMEFPNDFLIISGKRKDELEKELARDLKDVSNDRKLNFQREINPPDDTSFDFYKAKGVQYTGSTGFSSDYFLYSKDSSTPVFDTLNYKESLNNLLLNIIPTQKQFYLKQKLYGYNTESYAININDFYNYFDQDHQIFVGWQSAGEDDLEASIIIQNISYSYIHLLIIKTDKEAVFGDGSSIEGTFYAFIPKNNLKQK